MVTTPKIQQQKYYITGLVFQSPSRQDAYTRNLTQNELTLRHTTLISRGYGGPADLQIGHSSRDIPTVHQLRMRPVQDSGSRCCKFLSSTAGIQCGNIAVLAEHHGLAPFTGQ